MEGRHDCLLIPGWQELGVFFEFIAAFLKRDCPAHLHDTIPGHAVTRWQLSQSETHLTRTARHAGNFCDLAITGNAATRNLANRLLDFFAPPCLCIVQTTTRLCKSEPRTDFPARLQQHSFLVEAIKNFRHHLFRTITHVVVGNGQRVGWSENGRWREHGQMRAGFHDAVPLFGDDSGLRVKSGLNRVPMLLRAVQNGVYLSYTL